MDATEREPDDPLWFAAFAGAGLSAVAFSVFHLQTQSPPMDSPWDPLFFLPLMAVGMARRVRQNGGNVTQRVQEVFSRQATAPRRPYSRSFAAYLLLVYACCVVIAVAWYGLSVPVLTFVVGQGALTAFVASRASWSSSVPDAEPPLSGPPGLDGG